MSENGKKCRPLFPKAQHDVLKCLVLSTTHNQITVIEEERNQKIFTFKKLESENVYFFL